MSVRLVVCATALLLGSVSLVSAQSYSVLTVSSSDNGTVLGCQALFGCVADGSPEMCENDELCTTVSTALSVCLPRFRPLAFEVFCCDTVNDCPLRDGLEAESCRAVVADVHLCQYGEGQSQLHSLCPGAFSSPLAAIAACYAPDTWSERRQSLAVGDCDQDGQVNSEDLSPCSSRFIPVDDAGVDGGGVTITPVTTSPAGSRPSWSR